MNFMTNSDDNNPPQSATPPIDPMEQFMWKMLDAVEKMIDNKLAQAPIQPPQWEVIPPQEKVDDSVESISIDRMKDIKSNLIYFITKKTFSKWNGNRVKYDQHSIPLTNQWPNRSTFFDSANTAKKYIEEHADPKDKAFLKVQSKTVLSD